MCVCLSLFLLAFPQLWALGIKWAAIWSPGPSFTATMGPVLDAQFIKEKNETVGKPDEDGRKFRDWI